MLQPGWEDTQRLASLMDDQRNAVALKWQGLRVLHLPQPWKEGLARGPSRELRILPPLQAQQGKAKA